MLDLIESIKEERESDLVKIISDNLEGLKAIDFGGFVSDLRSQDYVLSILDMDQMERITDALEVYWKENQEIPSHVTRLAKVLSLPSIVVYEAVSKESGEDKKYLDQLWESFVAIPNGSMSLYGNSSESIISALKGVPEDALYEFGPMPRIYHGRRIETRKEMENVESEELARITREFIEAVGDKNKARDIATRFCERHEDFYENTLRKEALKLGRGASVIGDYYNGAEIRILEWVVVDKHLKQK